MVENIAVSIMRYQENQFKINYGFGHALKNIGQVNFVITMYQTIIWC